jgi:hypothetical protein
MTTGKGPVNSPAAPAAVPCRVPPAPGSAAHERARASMAGGSPFSYSCRPVSRRSSARA